MNLFDYWYLWPFAGLLTVFLVWYLVMLALRYHDYRQRRRMRAYSQRYGSAEYIGQYRPNFRKGERH